MCQITKAKNRVMTAKSDITVYKLVDRGVNPLLCETPYKHFEYMRDWTYKGRYQGRAFNDRIYRLRLRARHRDENLISLGGEGFHSLRRRKEALSYAAYYGFFCAEFVIPKGSKYIEGKCLAVDTIVSERIRFVKLIKL